MDPGELHSRGCADEAIATAQIEGETLQVHSVGVFVAQRLGLADVKVLERDSRTAATIDVLQVDIEQSQQALRCNTLYGWQAALFPNGRSGIKKTRTGANRDHAEVMQIFKPRIGKRDIAHYQAPNSADVQLSLQISNRLYFLILLRKFNKKVSYIYGKNQYTYH